jgi:hypothetical protein
MEVVFPISVRFEDGAVEQYESVEDLVTELEDFDSDVDAECDTWDAQGRPVRLVLKTLTLKELSLRTNH